MKIKLSTVIFCLFLLLLFGCQNPQIKNIHSRGNNIICFGDSLTYGYEMPRGQDYPSQLAKMLNAQVINAGVNGNTSFDALGRFEKEVLLNNPLLVIITIGSNDFIKNIPKEETAENLISMIDKAQAKGAMVAVMDISSGLFMKDYQPLFRRIASDKKAIFIQDAFLGIITNPRLKSDFVHPNALGYKLVVQRVYRTILPYLNANFLSKNQKS